MPGVPRGSLVVVNLQVPSFTLRSGSTHLPLNSATPDQPVSSLVSRVSSRPARLQEPCRSPKFSNSLRMLAGMLLHVSGHPAAGVEHQVEGVG